MSSTAARHARFRQAARAAGRRQIGTWISREAAEHLDVLLATGEKLDALVTAAILVYRPGATLPAIAKGKSVASNVSSNGAGLSPEVRAMVLGWRAEGIAWAECARRLDERGIPTPKGGRWLIGSQQNTNLPRFFR